MNTQKNYAIAYECSSAPGGVELMGNNEDGCTLEYPDGADLYTKEEAQAEVDRLNANPELLKDAYFVWEMPDAD